MSKKWLFLLLTIFLALPAQADIFKCKNGKGKITYQQSPCPDTMVGKVAPEQDAYLEDQIRAQNRTEQMKKMVRLNEATEAARRERGAAARREWAENQRRSALGQDQTNGNGNIKSSPPGRDVGLCMADCSNEQGICISQCQGNGQCIGNCGAAWGRCAGRCN